MEMNYSVHSRMSKVDINKIDTTIIKDIDKNKNNISNSIKHIECNGGYYSRPGVNVNDEERQNLEEKIQNYPANLESLFVNCSKCIDYDVLPYTLKILILYVNVLEPLLNLHPNLKEVKITAKCNLHIMLPDSVKHFNLSGSRNKYKDTIVLSKNLTHLSIDSQLYNQIYTNLDDIPDSIIELNIFGNTHIKQYPKNVQRLTFYKKYNFNNKPLANFPDSVISLSIHMNHYITNLKLPPNLEKLNICYLHSPCFLKSTENRKTYAIPDSIRYIICKRHQYIFYNIVNLIENDLLNISDKFKNLIIHGVIKIDYNVYSGSCLGRYSNYKKEFDDWKHYTEKKDQEYLEKYWFINYYIHGTHIEEKYIPGYGYNVKDKKEKIKN